MKRTAGYARLFRTREKWRRLMVTVHGFAALSLFSALVFVALGLGGMLQNRLAASPVQSMKGFAASVSSSFFTAMLGMELPLMTVEQPEDPFSGTALASFLVRYMTGIDPDDPVSLLSLEMPGAVRERAILLRPGSGGRPGEAPADDMPILPESAAGNAAAQESPPAEAGEEAPSAEPGEKTGPLTSDEPGANPPPEDGAELRKRTAAAKTTERTTYGRKAVLIYHTHNRESWFPELKKGAKDPNDEKINITLVGRRLAEQLERHGVGAVHSDKDYATAVKGYNWNHSYQYSLQTIKQAIADYGDLQFFFDIHRDSSRRNKTTVTIDGKTYAQVYFIIGHRNKNWRKNEAFANAIHEALEKSYPGLSRGIWGKTAANGNGEYNQSVAAESVLIEIGGVDNTLEECYRTADVLAEIIADLYWQKREAMEAGAVANEDAKFAG